jgi:UDP:flavonoid glycosyltransferase YjiC (YdhE family)
VLFLVNGLGLGNATRCHAVMHHLAAAGAHIGVLTSGNGAWYLGGRPEIAELHELEAFWYGSRDGKLSITDTLGAAGSFFAIGRRNDARVGEVLAQFKPDVCVTDSVYSICRLKRAGVKLAAINNADVVHASWARFPERPSSIRAQFHVIEENDYRFHKWTSDLVLSPVLDPTLEECGAPFRRIGPIVRPDYTPQPRPEALRVAVMLSGSVLGTRVQLTGGHPFPIDVIGRDADQPPAPGVTFHGKVRDSLPLLRGASLAVVNGGFSAVSEMFAMRMPMIVVPVPNHAEQWINAATIQRLGVGFIGQEEDLEGQILRALGQLDAMRAAWGRIPPPPDGARQAAEGILELAGR